MIQIILNFSFLVEFYDRNLKPAQQYKAYRRTKKQTLKTYNN